MTKKEGSKIKLAGWYFRNGKKCSQDVLPPEMSYCEYKGGKSTPSAEQGSSRVGGRFSFTLGVNMQDRPSPGRNLYQGERGYNGIEGR